MHVGVGPHPGVERLGAQMCTSGHNHGATRRHVIGKIRKEGGQKQLASAAAWTQGDKAGCSSL